MAAKKHPIKAAKNLAAPADTTKVSKRKERYTGRLLVRLDPTVNTVTLIRQAKAAGLQLAVANDAGAGATEPDGIIFERLQLAVVGPAGADALRRLQALLNSPFLSSEPERYIKASAKARRGGALKDTAAATWGIQAINVSGSAYSGKGVKLAILDTGFDFTHPDFSGRTIHRKSFTGKRQATDGEGHGTHTAAIAGGGTKGRDGVRYGVAPGTRLYIGKILDDDGEGTDGQALAGIEWALEKDCRVISMSFGAPGEATHSAVFEQVAQIALANHCLLIAASGNESDREEGFVVSVNHPANCPSILAVGALTPALEVAAYTCAGDGAVAGGQVDIAAPGDAIYSAKPGGGHRRESGTSMATAFVAGLAALLWEQYPKASAGEIWMRLVQQARRLKLSAADAGAGLAYGR